MPNYPENIKTAAKELQDLWKGYLTRNPIEDMKGKDVEGHIANWETIQNLMQGPGENADADTTKEWWNTCVNKLREVQQGFAFDSNDHIAALTKELNDKPSRRIGWNIACIANNALNDMEVLAQNNVIFAQGIDTMNEKTKNLNTLQNTYDENLEAIAGENSADGLDICHMPEKYEDFRKEGNDLNKMLQDCREVFWDAFKSPEDKRPEDLKDADWATLKKRAEDGKPAMEKQIQETETAKENLYSEILTNNEKLTEMYKNLRDQEQAIDNETVALEKEKEKARRYKQEIYDATQHKMDLDQARWRKDLETKRANLKRMKDDPEGEKKKYRSDLEKQREKLPDQLKQVRADIKQKLLDKNGKEIKKTNEEIEELNKKIREEEKVAQQKHQQKIEAQEKKLKSLESNEKYLALKEKSQEELAGLATMESRRDELEKTWKMKETDYKQLIKDMPTIDLNTNDQIKELVDKQVGTFIKEKEKGQLKQAIEDYVKNRELMSEVEKQEKVFRKYFPKGADCDGKGINLKTPKNSVSADQFGLPENLTQVSILSGFNNSLSALVEAYEKTNPGKSKDKFLKSIKSLQDIDKQFKKMKAPLKEAEEKLLNTGGKGYQEALKSVLNSVDSLLVSRDAKQAERDTLAKESEAAKRAYNDAELEVRRAGEKHAETENRLAGFDYDNVKAELDSLNEAKKTGKFDKTGGQLRMEEDLKAKREELASLMTPKGISPEELDLMKKMADLDEVLDEKNKAKFDERYDLNVKKYEENIDKDAKRTFDLKDYIDPETKGKMDYLDGLKANKTLEKMEEQLQKSVSDLDQFSITYVGEWNKEQENLKKYDRLNDKIEDLRFKKDLKTTMEEIEKSVDGHKALNEKVEGLIGNFNDMANANNDMRTAVANYQGKEKMEQNTWEQIRQGLNQFLMTADVGKEKDHKNTDEYNDMMAKVQKYAQKENAPKSPEAMQTALQEVWNVADTYIEKKKAQPLAWMRNSTQRKIRLAFADNLKGFCSNSKNLVASAAEKAADMESTMGKMLPPVGRIPAVKSRDEFLKDKLKPYAVKANEEKLKATDPERLQKDAQKTIDANNRDRELEQETIRAKAERFKMNLKIQEAAVQVTGDRLQTEKNKSWFSRNQVKIDQLEEMLKDSQQKLAELKGKEKKVLSNFEYKSEISQKYFNEENQKVLDEVQEKRNNKYSFESKNASPSWYEKLKTRLFSIKNNAPGQKMAAPEQKKIGAQQQKEKIDNPKVKPEMKKKATM